MRGIGPHAFLFLLRFSSIRSRCRSSDPPAPSWRSVRSSRTVPIDRRRVPDVPSMAVAVPGVKSPARVRVSRRSVRPWRQAVALPSSDPSAPSQRSVRRSGCNVRRLSAPSRRSVRTFPRWLSLNGCFADGYNIIPAFIYIDNHRVVLYARRTEVASNENRHR